MTRNKIVIGLTGGLCSGKSTVAAFFAASGAVVMDADRSAHRVLESRLVKKAVVGIFGAEVLRKGRVSRSFLRGRVFSKPKLLRKLCALIHPRVLAEMKKRARQFRSGILVLDVPLLFETGCDKIVDKVVLVSATKGRQLKRARGRGMSRDEALSIIRSQLPLRRKRLMADFIIDNNSGLKRLNVNAARVFAEICALMRQQKGRSNRGK